MVENLCRGRLVATLPFVRMVGIGGSLAVDNVTSPRDDIDLMIVARQGRVWTARALSIAVVHLARRWPWNGLGDHFLMVLQRSGQ